MTFSFKKFGIVLALSAGLTSLAHADNPVLMSTQWATNACETWNKIPELMTGLGGKWINNNKGRGYKIIHMYRQDCKDSQQVELKIVPKDGKAYCAYGGKVVHTSMDDDVDYLMYAETDDWEDMGKGEYGPMHAMMFGDLKFEGPKGEAMSVMGPFSQFLLLIGKVPYSTASCPAK